MGPIYSHVTYPGAYDTRLLAILRAISEKRLFLVSGTIMIVKVRHAVNKTAYMTKTYWLMAALIGENVIITVKKTVLLAMPATRPAVGRARCWNSSAPRTHDIGPIPV